MKDQEDIMALSTQPTLQTNDLKNLDFFLWRIKREKESQHRRDVERAYNERPRDRGDTHH